MLDSSSQKFAFFPNSDYNRCRFIFWVAERMKKLFHHVHYHGKRAVKHVHKHHKKYLFGIAWSYFLVHLLIFKGFVLKVFLIKMLIVALTSVWIYESSRQLTFADLEKWTCINNQPVVAGQNCNKNFSTIQKWLLALEKEVNFIWANIDSFSYHKAFQDILEQHCSSSLIEKLRKPKDYFTQRFIDSLDTLEDFEQLEQLDTMYLQIKTTNSNIKKWTTANFCKQKYILHGIQEWLQGKYYSILEEHELMGSQPIWNDLNEKKIDILVPALEKSLETFQKYIPEEKHLDQIEINMIANQSAGNEYTQLLKDKIMELTQKVVKHVLKGMINDGIFTSKDVMALKDKITVKYMRWCRETRGGYTISKNKEKVGTFTFEEITLHVNLCPSYKYINNLPSYLEEIFIHELGHHVYYFKDPNPKSFERICRKNNKKTFCESEDFVSRYAKTKAIEDYPESFLHRYLDKKTFHSDALRRKHAHFDRMFY